MPARTPCPKPELNLYDRLIYDSASNKSDSLFTFQRKLSVPNVNTAGSLLTRLVLGKIYSAHPKKLENRSFEPDGAVNVQQTRALCSVHLAHMNF